MNITVTGLGHALQTVRRYVDAEDKAMELAYRLCEIGAAVADGTYHDSASVTVARTKHGARVNIDGEDVLFIEFGAGDASGALAHLYDAVPAVVAPGTWSATHAQMYSRFGFWVFANRMYHEVAPHPATYEAYQEMVRAIPKVAEEVFK